MPWIEFVTYTDQTYAPGERYDFPESIASLYVDRCCAKRIDPHIIDEGMFDEPMEGKQNKMMGSSKVKKKTLAEAVDVSNPNP